LWPFSENGIKIRENDKETEEKVQKSHEEAQKGKLGGPAIDLAGQPD